MRIIFSRDRCDTNTRRLQSRNRPSHCRANLFILDPDERHVRKLPGSSGGYLRCSRLTDRRHRYIDRFIFWPRSALVDPVAQQCQFLPGQTISIGRHPILIIVGQRDPLDQLALLRISRNDGRVLAIAECLGPPIQPQFTFLFLRAVALEAVTLEQWHHLLLEVQYSRWRIGVIFSGRFLFRSFFFFLFLFLFLFRWNRILGAARDADGTG